ncbi:MAG: DUF1572 domain-containing protein [Acidobacteriaceae bacterium]|jgi:hypothetical protein|nr:DUF1572 domain-containing protein [Acidobacteriaceae bacterium]
MFVKDFIDEYERYRLIGERALAQVSGDGLNRVVAPDGNSVAMLVRHISGNFTSRFTNFLTSDGEKPWRNRDDEFAEGTYSRAEVDETWTAGWRVLNAELRNLTEDDLARTVTIRGQALTVHAALSRSLAHVAMHVGQIVLLARILATKDWQWISIPKGQSQQYNQKPTLEKRPE